MEYTIREIGKMFSLTPSTLRYYEELGLLTHVEKNSSGQRVYREMHVGRLRAICCFKNAGMTIRDLQDYFSLEDQGEQALPQIVELLSARQTSMRQRMTELQRDYAHLSRKIQFYSDSLAASKANAEAKSTGSTQSAFPEKPLPLWKDYKTREKKRSVVVLDTDAGTDDATAFAMWRYAGSCSPDYIVTAFGNTTLQQATQNVVVLNKYFGLGSRVVRGLEPAEDANLLVKNTFHGPDGLAGISGQLTFMVNYCPEDEKSVISIAEFRRQLLDCEEITYITIGPVSTLSLLLGDDEIGPKIRHIYMMGGGFAESNCPHGSEFNFHKHAPSVQNVIAHAEGRDMVLFPLDLTNHQFLTAETIDQLAAIGNRPEFITILRHNKMANQEYNQIDAAVLHDTMPILYYLYPEKFTVEARRILCDEHGRTYEAPDGFPVQVATHVDSVLMPRAVARFFSTKGPYPVLS